MKNLATTVLFFGNGPVAAASLQGFIDSFGKASVEAVVTKSRPPHHKDIAPVEQLATELGLPTWFANTKQQLSELIAVKQPNSLLGIIIDYGVIVNAETIRFFQKGIINSHFSVLPEWRGADPITYSLLSGQLKTGVSIMLIDEGLDTGSLLATSDYTLNGTETGRELTDELVELSNKTIEHLLPLYIDGVVTPHEQQQTVTTYSRKLTKQDGALLFTKTASELEREVRAFSGWPKSRTVIAGNDCVITIAKVAQKTLPLGTIEITPENTIIIGCRVASLEIIELQPAGKNKMPVSAFLNGYGHLL